MFTQVTLVVNDVPTIDRWVSAAWPIGDTKEFTAIRDNRGNCISMPSQVFEKLMDQWLALGKEQASKKEETTDGKDARSSPA